MSDSGRPRRVGDETRQRIDELADGWGVPAERAKSPAEEPKTEAPASPAPRAKAPTAPPPLPEPRAKRPTAPPPVPPARAEARPEPDPPVRAGAPPAPPPADRAAQALASTSPPIRVRTPATLRRKRGPYGDALYVFSVFFGVTQARRELADVVREVAELRGRRETLCIDLASAALGLPSLTSPVLERARERFVELEEERSRCAGVASATDDETNAAEKAGRSEAAAIEQRITALRASLSRISADLAPLETELAAVRRRAADLKGSIGTLERRIATGTAKSAGGISPEIEADLAALRADRDALIADEPALAAELDRLTPERNALVEKREQAQRELDAARDEKAQHEIRTAEVLEALRARRAVEARAVADLERRRQERLAELGGELVTHRLEALERRTTAIDRLDAEIDIKRARQEELDERITAIDRAKLARGVAIWVVVVGAIAAVALFATGVV